MVTQKRTSSLGCGKGKENKDKDEREVLECDISGSKTKQGS